MRLSICTLLALCASPAAAFVPPVVSRVAAPRRSAVSMNQRYSEDILNDNIPDPVYDAPSPYKGRVPWGFCNNAEVLNGRVAMVAFVILFIQELVFGKGVLELYGAPQPHEPRSPLMGGEQPFLHCDFHSPARYTVLFTSLPFPTYPLSGLPYDAGAVLGGGS